MSHNMFLRQKNELLIDFLIGGGYYVLNILIFNKIFYVLIKKYFSCNVYSKSTLDWRKPITIAVISEIQVGYKAGLIS